MYSRDYEMGVALNTAQVDGRKRANCVKLLKGMLERGVPIDGVGTQSHFHLSYPMRCRKNWRNATRIFSRSI